LFDTFTGLPMHVLVIHFVVVLVPLSAMATIAVFLRPTWRERYAAPVAALNVAMLVLTFVTVEAGWDLQSRYRKLGDTQAPKNHHEGLGKALLIIVLVLAVASVGTWAGGVAKLPALAVTGLAGLVAVLAVASIVLTVLTGDAGSRSHWADFIKSSDKAAANHQ
jgi:uncharacterized membrane protein